MGSHLLNISYGRSDFSIQYIRDGKEELDFVILQYQHPILAIEVKSGRAKGSLTFKDCPIAVIHPGNIESFLSFTSIEDLRRHFA